MAIKFGLNWWSDFGLIVLNFWPKWIPFWHQTGTIPLTISVNCFCTQSNHNRRGKRWAVLFLPQNVQVANLRLRFFDFKKRLAIFFQKFYKVRKKSIAFFFKKFTKSRKNKFKNFTKNAKTQLLERVLEREFRH